MSLAKDLLNSLPDNQVATYGIDSTTEPHIVINADKTVTVPEVLKRIIVQYEHNIETFTFDCPRYWDGHDLSEMRIRIVFKRADGHSEPHPVENLRIDDIDDHMIHFEWTISENVTLVSGSVLFTVCAKIVNVEGEREREWHTIPNRDLVVNEGMDCSGEEIVEQNPDIIDSILERLDVVEQGGASDEQIAQAVDDYLAAHPVSGGSEIRVAEIALPAANWVPKDNYYSQVVELAGVTEYTQVDLTPSVEQLNIFHDKDLTFVAENDGGTVTVYAIGQKPENDYTIQVTIKEVAVDG